jgi:hypothetical protein
VRLAPLAFVLALTGAACTRRSPGAAADGGPSLRVPYAEAQVAAALSAAGSGERVRIALAGDDVVRHVRAVHFYLETKEAADLPPPSAWLDAPHAPGPGLAKLEATPLADGWFRVRATFVAPPPPGARVRVLHKALDSHGDWRTTDAEGSGTSFGADVRVWQDVGLFAVENAGGRGVGWRYPDVLKETPYLVAPPRR